MYYYLNTLKTLSLGDFRNVQRDSLLGWMVFIPLFTGVLVRIFVPRLTDWLLTTYTFDLTPYYGLILSYLIVLITPILFGAVIGFLLLDERDDHTLTALQVTPLSLSNYLLYRLGMPIFLSIFMNLVIFSVAGLGTFPFSLQVMVTTLAALQAPLFALFLAAFAENKVAGFALMKGINAVLILPTISFFFPPVWQFLTGLIPTFWPLKLFWVMSAGGNGWVYFVVGILFQLGLLWVLLKRFERVLHR
jgi:fluoroquinolone transport system permease protein